MAFPVAGAIFTGAVGYLMRRRWGSLLTVVMAMLGAWLIKLVVILLIKFFVIYFLLFTNFGAQMIEDFSVWMFTLLMSFIDDINLDVPRPTRPGGLFTVNLMRLVAVLRIDDIALLTLYFLLMWIVIKLFLLLIRFIFLGRA